MSMAQQELDYTTLKWVKNEIQESLNQTRQALEVYVENPNDTTQLRFCTTYLHQIYGTLQMVEIYGGALLAEEMEHTASALLQEKVLQKEDAYDVLMRAILQLPAYLEHLENGQQDQPVILMPLLNDLRSARGENLLSENAFFSPDLSVQAPTETDKDKKVKKPVDIQQYAKKLRPVYQASLVGIYRNKNQKESLQKLAVVLRELLQNTKNESASRLWWVATGVVEAIIEGGIEPTSSIKQLLGQLDRQVKRIIQNGENAFTDNPPTELLKNLLYYVANSKSKGTRVEQIKSAFNLDKLLPGSDDIGEAFENLRGSNQELMQSVSSVIKEDLLQVKDQLDIFVRSKEQTPKDLSPLADHLGKISDALAMLGLGDLHKIIQDQMKQIQDMVTSNTTPSEVHLMEVASALLYVESSLDTLDLKQISKENESGDDKSKTESLLPPSEQRQLTSIVVAEANSVLAQVKEHFNSFANDTSQQDAIESTPELLNQVRGALNILGYKNAANILQSSINYIANELLLREIEPNQTALDLLADVITSVEYYLEAKVESRAQPDTILEVGIESNEKLGYPVEISVEEVEAAISEPPQEEAIQVVSSSGPITERIEDFQDLMPTETVEHPTEEIVVSSEIPQPQAASFPEDEIDEEILEIFIEEADEVVGTMQENLALWKSDPNNEEALSVLRRSYHTIKGSGRLAGAKVIGEFAWSIENMLNRVIEGKIERQNVIFDILAQAEKQLQIGINRLKGEHNANELFDVQPLVSAADAVSNNQTVSHLGPTTRAAPVAASEPESEIEAHALPTEDPVLVDIFKKETGTHLQNINAFIGSYKVGEDNPITESLLRALHTLHGSARMARVENVATISEHLDRYFRALSESTLKVDDNDIAVLKDGVEVISELTQDIDEDSKLDANAEALLDRIRVLHEEAVSAGTDPSASSLANLSGLKPFPGYEALSTLENEDEASINRQTIDAELISIFIDEATEILNSLEPLIFSWQKQPNDIATMEKLQRSLHTLKGGARMANVPDVGNLCQSIEAILENLIETKQSVSNDLPKLVQHCHDWLVYALGIFRDGAALEKPEALISEIRSYLDQNSAEMADKQNTTPAAVTTEESVPTEIIDFNLSDLEQQTAEVGSSEEDDLLAIFLEEANDLQQENESTIEEWLNNTNDTQPITTLQRSLHTLKGGARMAKVTAIADVSHALESLLETIAENNESNTDADSLSRLPGLLHKCHDWIGLAISNVQNKLPLIPDQNLLNEIHNFLKAPGDRDVVADFPETEINLPLSAAVPDVPEETQEVTFQIEEKHELLDRVQSGDKKDETTSGYNEELVSVFLEEAEEIQENNDKIIHRWVEDINNREIISELQRSLHTLKGGARMANIDPIGNISHAIESLLEAVTENNLTPTEDFPKVILRCHDYLSNSIEHVKNRRPMGHATTLIKQLENLLAGKDVYYGIDQTQRSDIAPPEIEPEEPKTPEPEKPAELIQLPADDEDKSDKLEVSPFQEMLVSKTRSVDELVRVRAMLLDNLANHAGEINIYNSRIGQQLNSWHFNLTELDQTVKRIHEQLRKFEIEAEAQIMYRHTNLNSEVDDQFDPLELDRFSYMQQLSRGMVESLNDLTSIKNLLSTTSGEADVLLLQQSRINTDLQEGLMRTRLTPFSSVIARLRRVIRQTCQETSKQAELKVVGAEGEMDRTQLNRIVPALEHILRNSVDHGVELPATRKKSDKPETGTIEINFTREGSEIVLKISDDGAGINVDAIRKKAVEKGLISNNSLLTDHELMDFILQSGFSTAEKVTQISGRGVGMDVVNTEIKQLNGALSIESELNKGTTITIRLPLTVLINQALMVLVDEAHYAVQLSNIEHVIRVTGKELSELNTGKQEIYTYAGNEYQHLNVGYVLHNSQPKKLEDNARYPLLLARSGDTRIALQIDQLLGRQEIVIKSLGLQLSSVNNISGATIMPDGEVALILDLNSLIRTSHAMHKAEPDELSDTPRVTIEPVIELPTVMIVDDSITVRKVTDRLLKRHDYNTITAKDGVDALTIMLETIPDIMLLDVEMPRMDGYELAQAMRNDPRLKDIPIIMITSRTGEKHRQRALSIGVNMYMGKPYQEQDLLENIQSLLN